MTVHSRASHKWERKIMEDRSLLPVDYYLSLLQKMQKSGPSIKEQVHCYGKPHFRMPGFATPAVYEMNGKQYVVIACGGGKLKTSSGDSYVAFALPN